MTGPPPAPDQPPRGRVVLVATPIGNLGDLSPRAVETLRGAAVICCEDTRRTRSLLSAAGVPAGRLVALHAHNEAAGAPRLVAEAAVGAVVAVVTDAGMPGISDPGSRLVRAALDAGVAVSVVPGSNAALAALVVSGLETSRFCFEGFLPRKGSERAARLAGVANEERTTVLYESPRRVRRTFEDLLGACGPDRPAAWAREVTKIHEQFWTGTLGGAGESIGEGEPRGEWVLVVGGGAPVPVDDDRILAALRERLGAGEDRRDVLREVARHLGVPRRRVYDLALAERGDDGRRDRDR